MALRFDYRSGGVRVPEGLCVVDLQADPAAIHQKYSAASLLFKSCRKKPEYGLLRVHRFPNH